MNHVPRTPLARPHPGGWGVPATRNPRPELTGIASGTPLEWGPFSSRYIHA